MKRLPDNKWEKSYFDLIEGFILISSRNGRGILYNSCVQDSQSPSQDMTLHLKKVQLEC